MPYSRGRSSECRAEPKSNQRFSYKDLEGREPRSQQGHTKLWLDPPKPSESNYRALFFVKEQPANAFLPCILSRHQNACTQTSALHEVFPSRIFIMLLPSQERNTCKQSRLRPDKNMSDGT